MRRALWHQHPHVANDLTFGERAADVLKAGFGSWPFIIVLNAVIVAWVLLQAVLGKNAFDPFPWLLLNIMLSWLAAQQGGALQIAANRGDRINSEVAVHTQANTDALMDLNRQQLEILGRLDGLDGKVGDLAGAVQVVMAARAEHESAVSADAKAARNAAESAFVATQALAAVAAGPQPVLPAAPAKPAKPARGGAL